MSYVTTKKAQPVRGTRSIGPFEHNNNLNKRVSVRGNYLTGIEEVLAKLTKSPANIFVPGSGYLQTPANLLKWSRDLTQAGYTKTNLTAAYNSLARASNANSYAQQVATIATVGNSGTIAVLAKPKSVGSRLGMRLSGGYPARVDAVFDLINGSVVGSAANTFTGNSASISGPDADGMYLCVLSGTSVGSNANAIILLKISIYIFN